MVDVDKKIGVGGCKVLKETNIFKLNELFLFNN